MVRFLLQLTPLIGLAIAIQLFLPGNGKVNRLRCLASTIAYQKVEIG